MLRATRFTPLRAFSTASSAYTSPSTTTANSAAQTTPAGLSKSQRECLDRAIRVDQAGEVAANWIYAGQLSVLGRDKVAGPLIQVD
jgi:ubiquinone biosynthesis monooxygenase Coq7